MTETITIQITAQELKELERLSERMGQDREGLVREIISRALDTLRMMEDAGL